MLIDFKCNKEISEKRGVYFVDKIIISCSILANKIIDKKII